MRTCSVGLGSMVAYIPLNPTTQSHPLNFYVAQLYYSVPYIVYHISRIFGGYFNLAIGRSQWQIECMPFRLQPGFLSIQYSKLPA